MGQRSLKIFENGTIRKLGMVSYSHSIATVAISLAVSEIFSVKEWHDLVIWVRGRSRSSQMPPIFYWSAIVSITLSCTIFELFDVD